MCCVSRARDRIRQLLRAGHHIAKWGRRCLGAVVVLVVAAVAVLAIRLSHGPIAIDRFKPEIESALQPGMLAIAEDKNLPRLRDAEIALMRASHAYGGIYDVLARHIVTSMGNLDNADPLPIAAE